MKGKIVISLYSLCLFATIFAVLMVAGCSGGESSSTSGDSGSGATQTVDLSGAGLTPDPSWHDSYLTGSHSGYDCSNCHTTTARSSSSATSKDVSGEQICYQCHADKYNNTALFNHGQNNAGTRCNRCHYSDSFTSHTRIGADSYHSTIGNSCESCHQGREPSSHSSDGRTSNCASCHQYSNGTWSIDGNWCHYSDSFPSHTRIGADSYHSTIGNSCESCHQGREPSSHSSDGRTSNCASCHQYSNGTWSIAGAGAHTHTSDCVNCHSAKAPANHYGTTCENCHNYPSWSGATFIHTNIVSGCASCHSRHYAGYACQWCHTFGISWSYNHSRVTAEACSACHGSNGGGDNEGGGHEAHTHTSDCVNCHSAKAPANHYGTTCENCHNYPSWSGATFIHTNIVSGCASCHSRHYAGYACQWCHTFGISWSYNHSRVTAEACSACHGSNGGGDNEGGGHDD